MTAVVPRLPFEPLALALGPVTIDHPHAAANWRAHAGLVKREQLAPTTSVAIRLGISRRTAWRWLRDGVPLWHADRLLTGLGIHPAEVWPDEYVDGIEP